jgi:hypothetical protein
MNSLPDETRPARLKLHLLLIAAACAAAHAAAPDETEILQAVEKVVAEHRVYATCLSLEPTSYRIVQDNWTREVSQGADALKALKPSPALIARFLAAVDSSRLIDKTMSLSAAMAYCQKNEAQVRVFHEFGFSRLGEAISSAAKSKARS